MVGWILVALENDSKHIILLALYSHLFDLIFQFLERGGGGDHHME